MISRSQSCFRVAVAVAALAGAARGGVRLTGMFSDGLVLQRGQPVPVWGMAAPGEAVTVAFADQTKEAMTGADGRWLVRLDPLASSRESRRLTVRGANTVEIRDVVVGEV